MPYQVLKHGSLLLGFTGEQKCPHCNNITRFEVRERYMKQKVIVLLASIPTGTTWTGLFKECPVCENEFDQTATKLFRKKATSDRFVSDLSSGKDLTLQYLSSLNDKDRKLVIKRLNSLGATGLVASLVS